MKLSRIQLNSSGQKATYWLGVVAVGLIFGLGIQFTQAWTNPAATPPDGNVSGPITTGSNAQWKTGTLGIGTAGVAANYMGLQGALEVNGQAKAARYYDDDPVFYVDANSTSIMNAIQADIVYDRNNAGFYVDPNNTSVMNAIQADIVYDRNNAAYYADLNNGTRINYILANNIDAYGYIAADSFVQGSYFSDVNNTGFYLDPDATSVLNWVHASIFFDRNNPNYYVNPDDTSIMNFVKANTYFDRNNPAYYSNFGGYSRMNSVDLDYLYSRTYINVSDVYIRASGKWASQLN